MPEKGAPILEKIHPWPKVWTPKVLVMKARSSEDIKMHTVIETGDETMVEKCQEWVTPFTICVVEVSEEEEEPSPPLPEGIGEVPEERRGSPHRGPFPHQGKRTL